MHTQSADAELKSSRSRFTARELRGSELGEAFGKVWELRRKFIIDQNFKCCCFQSKVSSVKRADPEKDQSSF